MSERWREAVMSLRMSEQEVDGYLISGRRLNKGSLFVHVDYMYVGGWVFEKLYVDVLDWQIELNLYKDFSIKLIVLFKQIMNN